MRTTGEMIEVLKIVMKPHGFNFGANIGRAAGAGIDNHIHFHIVPRWTGDTNFLPTLSDVKTESEDKRRTYEKIKSVINKRERHK